MLETLAGTPFREDVANAFGKVTEALPPAVRRFLDRLPGVIAVKGAPRPPTGSRVQRENIARLLEASVQHRQVRMRYHSVSSNRTKDYVVEPHQVVYGSGALYLLAFVPEYGEVRTFAIDRVEQLTVVEQVFEPVQDVTREVFPNSLGIHQGPPTAVVLVFDARIALPSVHERTWHPSQRLETRPDGGVELHMEVCDDWASRHSRISLLPVQARPTPVAGPAVVARVLRIQLGAFVQHKSDGIQEQGVTAVDHPGEQIAFANDQNTTGFSIPRVLRESLPELIGGLIVASVLVLAEPLSKRYPFLGIVNNNTEQVDPIWLILLLGLLVGGLILLRVALKRKRRNRKSNNNTSPT